MKLLLVEDSDRLRNTLARGLTAEGFVVDTAADGAQAQVFARTYDYELMILDLMLPRIDGLTVLRELAHDRLRPRVLILSARDQVSDRIEALDAGADDYLVKPFALNELLARLHALARRPRKVETPQLRLGKLRLDLFAQQAFASERRIPLTPREFALLVLLLRNRGRIYSRAQIQEQISQSDCSASDRSIEVLVFGLRRKLASASLDGLIENRRGAGYLIR